MNKIVLLLILAVTILSGCMHYTKIETDDYIIRIPVRSEFLGQDEPDIKKFNKDLFSVMVVKKNAGDYYGIEDCTTKELVAMLEGSNTYNIVTIKKKINGIPSVITRGVNFIDNKKIYWLIAIFQTDYYYYIIRILSGEKFFYINELDMEKIVYSFKIKNL